MGVALDLARGAAARGEVPVGAVVLSPDGSVIASAHNEREASHDPTAHAEVVALRRAGAAVLARVSRLAFGAWDPKAGAVGSLWDVVRDRRLNHRPEVLAGVREAECSALLAEFFAARR